MTLKVKREALYRLSHTSGKLFSVTFTKKNGEVRTMNCRTGVTSHLRGGECGIPEHLRKGRPYVVVFDVQKGEYRVFNVETATSLKMNGNDYIVV